nr:MAG: fatty acyl-AMP ligase [Leptolyngbya sp. IPPAS B-1204]
MSATPHPHPTIIHCLRQQTQDRPQHQAFVFLQDGETKAVSLTYQELDQQAQSVANWLQSHIAKGERALLVYPYNAGLEFIAAFLGCLYAGVIAVASHPPRNRSGLSELYGRLVSASASVILTTSSLMPKLKNQLAAADFSTDCHWCATNQLPVAPYDWQPPASDSLAFLQYTSGSTGTPKGVMVTHGNLMHNQRLLQLAFGHTNESIGVGWLPLFHDMGLIGNVLQAIYLGASCVLMSPLDFVQKPLRWLQAISRYQATTSGAPNFAYELLCRKVTDAQLETLNLSSWQVAFTGAEPVRADTLERFSQKFGVCGFQPEAFYPCYGMAEATLFISGGNKQTYPTVLGLETGALEQHQVRVASAESITGAERSIVSCGHGWLETEIAIVDPNTGQRCQPNQVGEIWVAGAGLGQGYWNQPQETAQTFQARLPDTPDKTYLRTGDLGFLYQNELFITGRLHDVLVFWGFNHYPQLIEQTVEACHPGFRPGSNAAFSIKINNEERLVIAQEVERSYRDRLTIMEVTELIRWRIFEEHFVDIYSILLLKPGTLPKTSSGKVQRSLCRTQLLNNQLEILEQWSLPADSPSDPTSVMERYFNLATHVKRYTNLTKGKLQRWLQRMYQGKD